MYHINFRVLTWTLAFPFVYACGPNAFDSVDTKSPAERAVLELEANEPDKAIDILQPALEKDPTNPELKSLLAAAISQKFDIDPLVIAQTMAANSSSSSSSTSGTPLTSLFSVLPAPTVDVLAGVDEAVALLQSIPDSQKTAADNFRLSLTLTASVSLHMKVFDTNGDGVLEPNELLAMSGGDASLILSQISSAQIAVAASSSAQGKNGAQAAGAVAQIQKNINAQPGATQDEKLKNYLASSSSSGSSSSKK